MTLIIVYLWFVSLQVVQARLKYNIQPPKTSGNSEFEKIYRIQVNTFEASILYIPLFTLLFFISNGFIAAAMIILWLIARIIFQLGYSKNVTSRVIGFRIQQGLFFISLGLILVYIGLFFI
jgi:hypothetical protein